MRKLFSFFAVLTVFLFMLACGGGKKETVYDYPDDDTSDIDISDVEISDEDSDDSEISDEDSDDTDIADADSDNPAIPDEDSDTPEIPEATENHEISGILQAGSAVSNVKAALVECGKTEEIASANTDANGKFSFNADISASKTYCVKANGFASCFQGMTDHVANISEITNAAYLLDKNCENIRKSETKVRIYAKLGTGAWLGELDYSKLSGIKTGLKLLSSFLDTTDSKTLSEKIAADVNKTEGREFEKFFNGFKALSDKKEVVINTTNISDNEIKFNVEGGSTVVAENFKIEWTALNSTAVSATHKITTVNPGEYIVRAKLVYADGDPIMGGDPIMISEDSLSVLYLLEKLSGEIDVSDMSKDVSHYITNGIYAVIPKNTTIKKDGNKINKLTYKILSAGDGSQVSKIDFGPDGAAFTNDSLYFVYELGTVFGGDPIMLTAKRANSDGSSDVLQSAGGDPIMLAAGGDPIMFSAGGDPIMQIASSIGGGHISFSASGDPIMIPDGSDSVGMAAGGDPIMSPAEAITVAAGDPIMLGTSSSVMIAKTGHFSGFLLNSTSLPVSVDTLVNRWCDGSYYHGYSPVAFIKKGVEDNKAAGADKNELLSYLDCSKIGELGNDLYELVNKEIGYQRNLNLFENIYYVSEFYNRMLARKNNGEVAAAKNGSELRNAIASLYTATTSLNRSATLADLFDSSKIPLTYNGNTPADYSADALAAVTGLSEVNNKYAATKKEMMIFANYITTSPKGPDFSGVLSALTPDHFVCAWFSGTAANCSNVYTLNANGHVSLGSTEVTVAEAEEIFAKYFMPFNCRLSDEEKLNLFRTYYLALKYIGTIFYGGEKVAALNAKLLETAYLVFDGINRNANAVSIVDTFDASANTVQVVENDEMVTLPYLNRLSSLTDLISLNVATAADVEKVLIKTEGFSYDKVTENTRTYYKPKGELKENSIILTPGNLAAGLKPLKELIGSENVDALGNIVGKMTVVVNSKISGKTYSTQKTYEFLINDKNDGVESKPLPSNLSILIHDAAGSAISLENNPGMILNPGNKTYYPNEDGEIRIENLAPASYTISAFADGYYGKNVGVNVPENATIGVEIKLDEEITSSQSEADLTLKVNINTVKHPDKVYIQIYDEDMELVANESAKFNEALNGYDDVNISINFGRYTLLAVGEEMYNYLEAITVNSENTVKEITIVAKNACGNGIIDAGEECETGDSDSTAVRCGDVFPASTNPENKAVCNRAACVYDKAACGAPTYSNCGDGIIDPGEGCDGGTKACSEILGANVKGTAPCAEDCSDWVIANNCTKTTAECAERPANTIWNDGTGRFTQTLNGSEWLPAAKEAVYGTTRDECVFSCDKGYKWDGSQCIAAPLSLGNICTGETSCFDNSAATECPAYGKTFFGQDAQYALVGYCTEKSFSQKGSNPQFIVVDDFTHYEWHKVADGLKNWDAAEEYCRTSTYGATQLYWKLPTPEELLTIVDSGRADSPLADIFSTSGHTFWANEDSRNSENAWRINENGALESVAKSTENYVLCVHVNEYDAPAQRFTAAEETVTDNVSGLIWQKQYASSKSWAEALSYCENSIADGKYDWRLPNRNELASLIDFAKTDVATSTFPGIAAKEFWSSTTATDSATAAWTVDFADGSITAETKSETNYVLCVRSDTSCLGSECVNPCDFEPCKNTVNSTGVCTATENSDGYSCVCYSGYKWDGLLSKCVLPEFRTQGCDIDKLPENAVWNQTPTITQYPDGIGNWYPTTVPEYNETPSTSECRFKCKDHYTWDYDLLKCMLDKKIAQCTGTLPGHAVWTVSQIVQEWSLSDSDWIPRANEMLFSEDENINRCAFKCDTNYTWRNNLCVADTKENVSCTGRPENAVWNMVSTINQTWNGEMWWPSENAEYNETPSGSECRYKCVDNYFYHDSECLQNPCDFNPCDIANSTGVCTASAWNEYVCECVDGYFWNDHRCNKPLPLGNICTGQTKCYDNSNEETDCPALGEDLFGQDAYYAAANFCVPQSFTIRNDVENEETVFDNNTGLEWQRTAFSADSWDSANDYCTGLTSYAGKSGWRLPSVNELQTIVDISRSEPAMNTDYFMVTNDLWSSDTYNDKAWRVRFGTTGVVSSAVKTNKNNYVRCVRGIELPYVTDADLVITTVGTEDIVTDKTTGLIWQRSNDTYDIYDDANKKTWQDALKYCEELTYAGFSDWRLPNRNELASLIDINSYNPATHFPEVIPAGYSLYFWSSSTRLYSNYAWSINFSDGGVSGSSPSYTDYVRCVRSDTCNGGKGIWNGRECVNPCVANKFWNGKECTSPCEADPNPCAGVENSTYECIALAWNKYSCGCENGYLYLWDNKKYECVPVSLARICTGQNKCYNDSEEIACPTIEEADFFGQDAWYAENGYCAPKKFTIDSTVEDQKTVIDLNTGLEWQQTVENSKYSWENADNYCRELNYAGKSGWRLPTRKEFYSIIDNGRTNPATDPEYFNSTEKFWTSTVNAQENSTNKWYVDFSDGSSGIEKTQKYVRCVRGEEPPEAVLVPSTVEGDDIMTDTTSGLVWQDIHGGGSNTWLQALEYCASLDYAGFSDWRLPSLNELLSIINDDKTSPASDFTNVAKMPYWTSTSSMTDPSQALYINFSTGRIGASYKTNPGSRYVKCVR